MTGYLPKAVARSLDKGGEVVCTQPLVKLVVLAAGHEPGREEKSVPRAQVRKCSRTCQA